MKSNTILLILFLLSFFGCRSNKTDFNNYESENLKIEKVTTNTFLHASYLHTKNFGKVPCNGMIVISDGEAIVFDTPTNNLASKELINWIQTKADYKIKAVIVTHFHVDCLGGLEEFHNKEIPSYANNHTIEFAKLEEVVIPQNGFENILELKVGSQKVINEFLGEGHTKDNIISYFPSEKVLFGGCLIKADGAGRGNLNDANVNEWSNTVEKVKSKYENSEFIIPGHGNVGGTNLLDYTIEMFKNP